MGRKWIALAKSVGKRKVAFILNNNPCANADANIGAATHLDLLESVARILSSMKRRDMQSRAGIRKRSHRPDHGAQGGLRIPVDDC